MNVFLKMFYMQNSEICGLHLQSALFSGIHLNKPTVFKSLAFLCEGLLGLLDIISEHQRTQSQSSM